MTRKTLFTVALACLASIALAAIGDLSGKWIGLLKTPDGNSLIIHVVFKVDSDKLTGTTFAEGDPGPLDIREGKIKGNNFSFQVTNQDGTVIPVEGKYVAQGDSVSVNFENEGKFHLTFKRESK